MASWRTRHPRGRGRSIPYDQTNLAVMCFFIVLATFFVVMALWGFGLNSGTRFF